MASKRERMGAHDGDVDLNSTVAVEDCGEHGDILLGEGEGETQWVKWGSKK